MSTSSCKKQSLVTQALLKELLELRLDGKFYWRNTKGRAKTGLPAGFKCAKTGYRIIGIRCAPFAAHRLAVLWDTGEWPKNLVTHKDKDRDNNLPDNLVDTTSSVVMQNRKGGKGGLPKGVKKVRGRYIATIVSCGEPTYLGSYLDAASAIAARAEAEIKYHTILEKKDVL